MYKYFISIVFLFSISFASGQTENRDVEKDSVVYKTAYGLRIGVDLSKPIRAALQDFYSGFEIVTDYRISKNMYIAAEFGTEEQTSEEDFLTAAGKGTYARLGVNFNTYDNWLDMNNEIFIGLRYGFSTFEQTLDSYTINSINDTFPITTVTTPTTTTGLNAHWGELMIGLKAEIMNNVFMGVSGSYKLLISVTDPDNFQSLFAPGFNRIYETSTGFGFNYTISYLIPFSKK